MESRRKNRNINKQNKQTNKKEYLKKKQFYLTFFVVVVKDNILFYPISFKMSRL